MAKARFSTAPKQEFSHLYLVRFFFEPDGYYTSSTPIPTQTTCVPTSWSSLRPSSQRRGWYWGAKASPSELQPSMSTAMAPSWLSDWHTRWG